jgi:putative ABC transport system ATP-binding protein
VALVELADVTKVYASGDAEVRALDGVSLSIAEGACVAIMGASGSGKSTMMNVLGCLDRPTSGSYRLAGRPVSELSARELARVRNGQIGFVFQQFNLLPRTSALDNVALPLVYAGVGGGERRRRAADALAGVGLSARSHHHPNQLSGGQQQRVAIARAIVNHPKMILADEPTGALDSRTSVEVMAVFQQLWRAGITVILVTHEQDIAAYAARVIVMRDGRVVSDRAQEAQTA